MLFLPTIRMVKLGMVDPIALLTSNHYIYNDTSKHRWIQGPFPGSVIPRITNKIRLSARVLLTTTSHVHMGFLVSLFIAGCIFGRLAKYL